MEEAATKDLEIENIEKRNIFHLTQCAEKQSIYHKTTRGLDSSYIPIAPKMDISATLKRTMRGSQSMINLHRSKKARDALNAVMSKTMPIGKGANVTKRDVKRTRRGMKKSKSMGWLSLVPKTTLSEIDIFDGTRTISIGERVVTLDEEEAEIMQKLDEMLMSIK